MWNLEYIGFGDVHASVKQPLKINKKLNSLEILIGLPKLMYVVELEM